MPYAFCSAKGCYHTRRYDKISTPEGDLIRPEPPICTKCGAKMRMACPICDTERDALTAEFCPKCGKRYRA